MNEKIIEKASYVIQAKTGGIGGGMTGYAILALIDENGYPTASTLTISKAEGIKWLTFLTSIDSNKAKRISKCNKGSVCLGSSEHNISLVGTLEVLTDPEIKKEMWYEAIGGIFSGSEDPSYCVIRFNTERYNLFFADDGSAADGTI